MACDVAPKENVAVAFKRTLIGPWSCDTTTAALIALWYCLELTSAAPHTYVNGQQVQAVETAIKHQVERCLQTGSSPDETVARVRQAAAFAICMLVPLGNANAAHRRGVLPPLLNAQVVHPGVIGAFTTSVTGRVAGT